MGRCLAAASVFLAAEALGGFVYDMAQTEFKGGKPGESVATEIKVEGSKIKMSGLGDENSEFIYDGTQQAMLILDHKRKSFMQLDKQTIDQIASQLGEAMKQMEEQMAAMPPAQRAMMEKMMKGKMPQGAEAQPELTVTRTGEKDTLSGFKAEKVEVGSAAGKQRELWVAKWSDLKGSEEVGEAFKGMSELFAGMMSAFSQGPMSQMFQRGGETNWIEQVQKLEGFPVLTREFDAAGKILSETALSQIREMAIPASEFEAPKGYKRQKLDQ